jgi:RHH-type rel operon transcriptional repressor/antitoxin RelB
VWVINNTIDYIVMHSIYCMTTQWRIIMSIAISVRLPDVVAKELGRVAKETERSRSFVVTKAVETYLDDFADLQVSLDRLHDTSDPVVSSQDMRASLGL